MDQNLQGSYLRHPHYSNIVYNGQHLYDQRNHQVFQCQNFQEKPKFVHVNPAFYVPLSNLSRPPTLSSDEMTIPIAKKVILNPKFFPNLQRERDPTPMHTISTAPSASQNQPISNNSSVKHVRADPVVTKQNSYSRYSWKKIEDVQHLPVKSGKSPKVIRSRFRLMKLPLKSPVRTITPLRSSSTRFFSRYRVDNRDVSKKLKSIKSPKQAQAKYRLIRKGFKTNLTKNLGVRLPLAAFSKSPSRLLKPSVVSHGRIYSNFSSFKVPVVSNRRSLLRWTSSNCRSDSKLRTPLKSRNGVKKRISASPKIVKSGKRRQRYYEKKQNEEEQSCELQEHGPNHEIVPEVEVSESGRIPRAPLGELPSFITL